MAPLWTLRDTSARKACQEPIAHHRGLWEASWEEPSQFSQSGRAGPRAGRGQAEEGRGLASPGQAEEQLLFRPPPIQPRRPRSHRRTTLHI